ncbi:transcription factor [Atractiella rhizophila]|nr:transcription factor [Atractiella rhizophila]
MSSPSQPNTLRAIVKSVLGSGDTVVLRGRAMGPGGALPKERTLHLAGLSAPRMGTRDRNDEPWAFESREFLRTLLVGKEVNFVVHYSTPTAGEFGIIYLPSKDNMDVALEVLRQGWAKLREGNSKKEGEEEEEERKRLMREKEEEAKREGRGIWAGSPPERTVEYTMPSDPAAFLTTHKGTNIDALVESVQSGSTLRVRLLLSPTSHQLINLTLAGIRTPRAKSIIPPNASPNPNANPTDNDGEEMGDEARFFVETRLLQRAVQVRLLSLPSPTGSLASNAPATISNIVGVVVHPAGNIALLLASAGLGRIVEWHAGAICASPQDGLKMMEALRSGIKEAQEGKRGIWKAYVSKSGTNGANGHASGPGAAAGAKSFQAVVTRIWTGDMVGVRRLVGDKEEDERRIQFSSIRQPRLQDPKVAGWQVEAKETLRKRLIGKTVTVSIDYVKPKEGEYDERECATVKLPNGNNVAEMLVERGLASVIRHRRDDEDRSEFYDRLIAAEAKAQSEGRGVHSGKDFPASRAPGDASESLSKATSFLSSFKRAGKIPVVVEFASSASRFKLFLPKQEVKLTLVLGGIRAPKTARDPKDKSEPFGKEALDWVNRRVLQRDAEIEVDSTDKNGGFIGSLYLSRTENLAVMLTREGFAQINDYSAEKVTFGKELRDAEEEAKKKRKNLWKDYDPETVEVEEKTSGPTEAEARTEYIDLVVSDIRGGKDTPFSFSIQQLTDGGVPALEKLMSEFGTHYSAAPPAPNFIPRSGDLVAARFTVDNVWYRAKIRRSNPQKKIAEVLFYDYGNSEELPYDRIRPLDPRFKALEPQSQDAALSFIKLLGADTEYGEEALERFRSLCEGRTLVANVDFRERASATNQIAHLTLYDPTVSKDAKASLNLDLVREGLAILDSRCKYRKAYPTMWSALEKACEDAKRSRAGVWEFGDALPDDD